MAIAGNPWGKLIKGNVEDMIKIINKDIKPEIPEHLGNDCKDFIQRCLVRDLKQRASTKELLAHPFVECLNK